MRREEATQGAKATIWRSIDFIAICVYAIIALSHPPYIKPASWKEKDVAKAQLTTASGVLVKVEGTPAEIFTIIQDLEKQHAKQQKSGPKIRSAARDRGRSSLADELSSLADGGFFKTPRDLATIKAALAQGGHHYPVTTLSGAMLTKVRKRELRRLKEEGRWLYTR